MGFLVCISDVYKRQIISCATFPLGALDGTKIYVLKPAAAAFPANDDAAFPVEEHAIVSAFASAAFAKMCIRDRAWKEEYGSEILKQLRKLGSSCDWDRVRFTMDEGCSKAVLETFIRLYNKGYIYRGEKLINWCPKCQTTISDAEVNLSLIHIYRLSLQYYVFILLSLVIFVYIIYAYFTLPDKPKPFIF